jgi:phosphoketolase
VSGGYHTDEVLAATRILAGFNQTLAKPIAFKTVAVAEPFKMRPAEGKGDFVAAALKARGRVVAEKADATVFDDKTYDALFPKGAPIVWSFGGFARTAEGLAQGRDRDVSVHGYKNEGSTTTRFDMMVQNGCDRFTIAADAVERAFRAGKIDAATKDAVQQYCADQLVAHDERMQRGDGDDPQWIKDGPWLSPAEALAPR